MHFHTTSKASLWKRTFSLFRNGKTCTQQIWQFEVHSNTIMHNRKYHLNDFHPFANTLVIFNMRWISISCTWAKSRHPSKTSREFILFEIFPFLLNWNKSSCMTYSSVKRTKKNTHHCRTTSSTKFKSFTFLLSLQSFPVIMIFSTKNLILQILISGQKLLPAQNWFPHKYIMNLLAINFHILRPK